MKYCPYCGKKKLVEIVLERHDSWYYCNQCKLCFTDIIIVPKEEVSQFLKEDGFPKDAKRALVGEPLSEYGE